MDTNPFGWFEIYVQDMNRTRKFYESVFQVKLKKLNPPDLELWGFPMLMDKTGASVALVKKAEIKTFIENRLILWQINFLKNLLGTIVN